MKNTLNVSTPTDLEVVMRRDFDASRDLVWQAMTTPKLLMRWLFGPPGWTMTVCEDDLKVGGTFRWEWSGPNGTGMAMHGIYREVVPPERVSRTESFEFGCAPQSGEQLATIVLTERANKTSLKLTVLYPTKEARDGAIASGMAHGVGSSYDRLDEMPVSMR